MLRSTFELAFESGVRGVFAVGLQTANCKPLQSEVALAATRLRGRN